MDFRQPINKALTTDITVAGGAKIPVILNGTLGAISLLVFYNLFLLGFFIIVHFIIVYLTKKDSKFFECFTNYLKYDDRYDS